MLGESTAASSFRERTAWIGDDFPNCRLKVKVKYVPMPKVKFKEGIAKERSMALERGRMLETATILDEVELRLKVGRPAPRGASVSIGASSNPRNLPDLYSTQDPQLFLSERR